jgi:hypothetical protein
MIMLAIRTVTFAAKYVKYLTTLTKTTLLTTMLPVQQTVPKPVLAYAVLPTQEKMQILSYLTPMMTNMMLTVTNAVTSVMLLADTNMTTTAMLIVTFAVKSV